MKTILAAALLFVACSVQAQSNVDASGLALNSALPRTGFPSVK